MATTIYSSVAAYDDWAFFTEGATEYGTDSRYAYPYPRAQDVAVQYQNKAWDTTIGQWLYWNTTYPDVGGQQYPGPGTWGVEVVDHGVEAVVLGRYQRL